MATKKCHANNHSSLCLGPPLESEEAKVDRCNAESGEREVVIRVRLRDDFSCPMQSSFSPCLSDGYSR